MNPVFKYIIDEVLFDKILNQDLIRRRVVIYSDNEDYDDLPQDYFDVFDYISDHMNEHRIQSVSLVVDDRIGTRYIETKDRNPRHNRYAKYKIDSRLDEDGRDGFLEDCFSFDIIIQIPTDADGFPTLRIDCPWDT